MRRSYRIDLGAGVDGLTLAEERVPELEPDQVLVRVHATSLSSRAIVAGSRAHLAAATASFATHLPRPAISRVFPFTEAREAYRYYESTNPFGKVVIAHNVGGEQQ